MSLQLKNVTRRVGDEFHLADLNVEFKRGSFNVLLGRTRAGKTSLLRLLAGLDQPSSGQLLMDGKDVGGIPVQQRRVSMVYQQFINYPNMTVFENIASPLRIARESSAMITQKVEEVAVMLRIQDYLTRRPLELSGGQQQRTAMARALVKNSELVLFDEPLVNLDYKLREELREELRALFRERDTIAVYASSEPAEALALGGVTTVLHEGRVLQSGPVSQVYKQPDSIDAAELFSEPPMNLLPVRLEGNQATLGSELSFEFDHDGQLAAGDYRMGLRPHHLKLGTGSSEDVSMRLQVDVAEISGSETYLHLSEQALAMVAQVPGVHSFHTDVAAEVCFSPRKLYVFDALGNTVLLPADLRSRVQAA